MEIKSTIQVSKSTLEEIDRYCTTKGRKKAGFVDALWKWFNSFKDDVDIWQDTPFMPVVNTPDTSQNTNQSDILKALETIVNTVNVQNLLETGHNLGLLESKNVDLESENKRLKADLEQEKAEKAKVLDSFSLVEQNNKALLEKIERLEAYQRTAKAEFSRIKAENKYFGKIEVYEP